MIYNKIEELFLAIENSYEYKEYKKIKKILEKDKEVMELIEEIKKLEQLATKLEFEKNPKYKEIDEITKSKVEELNNNQVYIEYLNKMEEFNEIMTMSSKMIEHYDNDKI